MRLETENGDDGNFASTPRLDTLRHPVCDDYCERM